MKNRKNFTAAMTASAVVAAMALPTVASAASVTFSDISNSYAQQAILDLANAGILHGDQGKFNPTGKISRQDFAVILVNSLGLKVTDGATSQFSDVAGYAQKYVKAATDAGLISGYDATHFGGADNLTREQMATLFVRALHYTAGYDATGKASKLNFSDKATIAANFQDSVGAAVELGLISGLSDGNGGMKFDPQGNAERQAVALVASKFLKAVDTLKNQQQLKITASATDVAVGQAVSLSVTGTTDTVAWSVDKNGVIDATGKFVGSSAGTATVTATVDGQTLTQVITVYGAAAAVKIDAPKNLTANGVSSEKITIHAVDANGNAVLNFNGSATVNTTGGTHVKFVPSTVTSPTFDGVTDMNNASVSFTNGVATVQAVAGTVPGTTDTLTLNNLLDANGIAITNYTAGSVDVTTQDQVATAIKVSAPSSLEVNNSVSGTVTATVVDQDGQEMLGGTYGLKFNISGPAKWALAGDTTEKDLSYTGGSAATGIEFATVQGKTGNITITVSGDGLTSGTATVKAAVVGDAASLVIANADTTATTNEWVESNGTNSVMFNLSANDADNNPVAGWNPGGVASTVYAYVTDASGNAVSGVTINGTVDDGNGVQIKGTTITLTDNGASGLAGNYKLVVKDSSGTLAASNTAAFKVDAAAASEMSLSAGTGYVAASNPTTTYSVQVTDAYGNAVADAGEPVTFSATETTGSGAKASFNNGTQVTAPSVTVNTDANGKATVTLNVQPYNENKWTVHASTTSGYTVKSNDQTLVVKALVPAALKVAVNATGTNSASTVSADSTMAVAISEVDAYGNAIDSNVANAVYENDQVKVTVSNPHAIQWTALTANGKLTVDSTAGTIQGSVYDVNQALAAVHANAAGTVSFTAQDLSISSATAGHAAINVKAGVFSKFELTDAQGNVISSTNMVSATANKEVGLYLKAVDAEGNVVAAPHVYTVNLNAVGGQFRTASNGTASDTITFANGATSMVVYYVNATTGTYVPVVSSDTPVLN